MHQQTSPEVSNATHSITQHLEHTSMTSMTLVNNDLRFQGHPATDLHEVEFIHDVGNTDSTKQLENTPGNLIASGDALRLATSATDDTELESSTTSNIHFTIPDTFTGKYKRLDV